MPPIVDLHQHLWSPGLLAALRARRSPPRLDGWLLELPGEPPYEVARDDHDPVLRARHPLTEQVVLGLSSPLGLEDLPADEAQPLLDAWHTDARTLPARLRVWAAVARNSPDLDGLRDLFADPGSRVVGLQVPATWMDSPAALETLAGVLAVCEGADVPVLVHPGPVEAGPGRTRRPAWWPALVDYPAQLQAAWWAWRAHGRSLLPELRICFVGGAGLAPLHDERADARGGPTGVDSSVFVDTSSYGPRSVRALADALGASQLVLGTDAPYADRRPVGLTDTELAAVCRDNPARLLGRSSA